jgi:o-succinylbenzoate synthase
MLKLDYQKYILKFKFEAGTSRGVLTERSTYFISVFDEDKQQIVGVGEASPLKGLSIDDTPDFEKEVQHFCQKFISKNFENVQSVRDFWLKENTVRLPSLRFAVEVALKDLENGGKFKIEDNEFYNLGNPLPINGLVWMGTIDFMRKQIEEKIAKGFTCLKLKIGAIDFDKELALLQSIRKRFAADKITLRVDANGAFAPSEALEKLKLLAKYELHSIEQPIRQGQVEMMRVLCEASPVPIALDEELIGIESFNSKKMLLESIKPQYIILKPTLLGGLAESKEWIQLAENLHIGWWITSALESNIGLNAICQFTAQYQPTLPQGLGTGQLYHNNIDSPLEVKCGHIFYNRENQWKF